jgi:hypothetical protein
MQVKAQPNRIGGVWLTSDKDEKIEIDKKTTSLGSSIG